MPLSSETSISVVGAGLAGLTLVLALQKSGFRPKIYEQSPFLSEIGAGIMLTPNSTRILNHLGLKTQLLERSLQPENNFLHDHMTDRVINRSDLGMRAFGAAGNPFCTIHRADLHSILSDAVRAQDPDCIKLDYSLMNLSDEGQDVRMEFENGAVVRSDIVIGSDGIHSVIRNKLFDASRPVFTGNVAWRGVVDNSDPAYCMKPSDMGNWIGPGRNVVVYPLRGGKELNYVAISERDTWVEEGWNVQSSAEELVQEFAGWSERMLAMFASTPSEKCFKWGLFDREPMPQIVAGRIALMGDAAHPMLPFLAQGSAMGIEDAIVIARCLSCFPDAVEALAAYQKTRTARTGWVQNQAREVRRLLHARSSEKELVAREERSRKIYGYNAVTTPLAPFVEGI